MRFWRATLAIIFGLLSGAGTLLASPVSAATAPISLSMQVGRPGTFWGDSITVNPGELLNVRITYTNQDKGSHKYLVIHDTLPSNTALKSGTTTLMTTASHAWVAQGETLTTPAGINTGNLNPGDHASVQFQVTMPPASALKCGDTLLTNTADGTTSSGKKSYKATSTITVTRDCNKSTQSTSPGTPATATTPASTPSSTTTTTTTTTTSSTSGTAATPTTATTAPATPASGGASSPSHSGAKFSCGKVLTFYRSKTRTARIKTFSQPTLSGASYTGTVIDWGDNSPASAMLVNPEGLSHTYANDGPYPVTSTLHFNVNGRDKPEVCTENISVKQKPAATTTPTAGSTTTPSPTVVDSYNSIVIIAPTYIDNSTNTTNVANAAPATPTAQVASATTTAAKPAAAATQPVASTDAKTLVNTGAGNVFGIFLVASLVGAIGSRLILYRLLGA